MRKEVIKTEEYIKDEVKRAETRMDYLGAHKIPSKKVYSPMKATKIKTGRMKHFYFKKHLNSWGRYLNKDITFEELMSLQKQGR